MKDMERLNLKMKNVDKDIQQEIIKIREDKANHKKELMKYNNEIITLLKSTGKEKIIEDSKRIKYCKSSWLNKILVKLRIIKKRDS